MPMRVKGPVGVGDPGMSVEPRMRSVVVPVPSVMVRLALPDGRIAP